MSNKASRFVAGLALLISLAVPTILAAANVPKKDEPIRKLNVTVDPLVAARLSGKPGVQVCSSEKELTESLGKAIARQIAGQIDFGKEDLVHVSWGSAGPPFGSLEHEISNRKDGKLITFYLKEPKASVRGQAFRLGNDLFVVPKKSQVRFGEAR